MTIIERAKKEAKERNKKMIEENKKDKEIQDKSLGVISADSWELAAQFSKN